MPALITARGSALSAPAMNSRIAAGTRNGQVAGFGAGAWRLRRISSGSKMAAAPTVGRSAEATAACLRLRQPDLASGGNSLQPFLQHAQHLLRRGVAAGDDAVDALLVGTGHQRREAGDAGALGDGVV